MSTIIDVFLHLDQHIAGYMNEYGVWIYVILFVIIFCETGLVVLPFLPGDSLLFASGALAASGSIHLLPIFLIFCVAAITGDTLNYTIGHYSGNKVEAREKLFFVKRESLDKTNRFFDKHGSATIILSRFIPIIRTFAPFTAGVGKMPYAKFLSYNVIGGIVWVSIALFAGYFFGNIPVIKDNFSVLVLGIVAVSLLPVAFAFVKNKWTALKN